MPAQVIHFLPLTAVRRARILPVPGRVLVRVGQQVAATDPIAETYLPEQHFLVDVRRALGMSSTAKAESLIQRKEGEHLQKGDVIAETGGLFSRVIRSPADGVIVAVMGGQVLLEAQGQPLVVRAGMPGTVTELVPERGALVETSGSLVQGVWGNNQVDLGVLLVLAKTPDEELTRDRLDVSMRGAVVLGGSVQRGDVLKAAADLPLRGLLLGSINPELVPQASALKFPVMVIEGFGRIPINSAAFKLLASSEKRDISINACGWDPLKGERPEAVIPLPADAERALETDEFKPGQTVRIQGSPYYGQTASVVSVHSGSTLLQNGLRAPAVDVRLENGERVTIPQSNLDIIE